MRKIKSDVFHLGRSKQTKKNERHTLTETGAPNHMTTDEYIDSSEEKSKPRTRRFSRNTLRRSDLRKSNTSSVASGLASPTHSRKTVTFCEQAIEHEFNSAEYTPRDSDSDSNISDDNEYRENNVHAYVNATQNPECENDYENVGIRKSSTELEISTGSQEARYTDTYTDSPMSLPAIQVSSVVNVSEKQRENSDARIDQSAHGENELLNMYTDPSASVTIIRIPSAHTLSNSNETPTSSQCSMELMVNEAYDNCNSATLIATTSEAPPTTPPRPAEVARTEITTQTYSKPDATVQLQSHTYICTQTGTDSANKSSTITYPVIPPKPEGYTPSPKHSTKSSPITSPARVKRTATKYPVRDNENKREIDHASICEETKASISTNEKALCERVSYVNIKEGERTIPCENGSIVGINAFNSVNESETSLVDDIINKLRCNSLANAEQNSSLTEFNTRCIQVGQSMLSVGDDSVATEIETMKQECKGMISTGGRDQVCAGSGVSADGNMRVSSAKETEGRCEGEESNEERITPQDKEGHTHVFPLGMSADTESVTDIAVGLVVDSPSVLPAASQLPYLEADNPNVSHEENESYILPQSPSLSAIPHGRSPPRGSVLSLEAFLSLHPEISAVPELHDYEAEEDVVDDTEFNIFDALNLPPPFTASKPKHRLSTVDTLASAPDCVSLNASIRKSGGQSSMFSLNSENEEIEQALLLQDMAAWEFNKIVSRYKEATPRSIPVIKLKEREITTDTFFGRQLQEIVSNDIAAGWVQDTWQVPLFLTTVLKYITTNGGLEQEGIFRKGGSVQRVRQLRSLCSKCSGDILDALQISNKLQETYHLNDIATVVKQFLRELPIPLLTYKLFPAFVSSLKLPTDELRTEALRLLYVQLPACNQHTLIAILSHLSTINDHKESNKMSTKNMATLMGPNLVPPLKDSMNEEKRGQIIQLTEYLITHYKTITTIPEDYIQRSFLFKPNSKQSNSVMSALRKRLALNDPLDEMFTDVPHIHSGDSGDDKSVQTSGSRHRWSVSSSASSVTSSMALNLDFQNIDENVKFLSTDPNSKAVVRVEVCVQNESSIKSIIVRTDTSVTAVIASALKSTNQTTKGYSLYKLGLNGTAIEQISSSEELYPLIRDDHFIRLCVMVHVDLHEPED
eukprot:CFRG0798T1